MFILFYIYIVYILYMWHLTWRTKDSWYIARVQASCFSVHPLFRVTQVMQSTPSRWIWFTRWMSGNVWNRDSTNDYQFKLSFPTFAVQFPKGSQVWCRWEDGLRPMAPGWRLAPSRFFGWTRTVRWGASGVFGSVEWLVFEEFWMFYEVWPQQSSVHSETRK